MFRVGQKVVCVDASRFEQYLDEGRVYTITSINAPYLRVDCRSANVTGGPDDYGYDASRFRPIVERKTDISIFKAMLTPAGKKERVS